MGWLRASVTIGLLASICYWWISQEEVGIDSLKGKRVVITGASSGIGEQLAYEYCRHGASVVITARREKLLQQVIKKCRNLGIHGGVYKYVAADMCKDGEPAAFIKEAIGHLGGIDQLIMNHGVIPQGREWTGSEEDIKVARRVMDVNYHSYIDLSSAALSYLEQANGSLGVVSSISGKMPTAFAEFYSASKFAVTGFFSGLMEQFKMTGKNVSITIHTIGLVDTEGARSTWHGMSKLGNNLEKLQKLGIPAKARDCANAILRATTLRQRELFFPSSQRGYWMTLVYHLWPEIVSFIRHKSGFYNIRTAHEEV